MTVNLGDEVYHAFELNVVFLVVAVAQDFARSAGEGFDVGKGGVDSWRDCTPKKAGVSAARGQWVFKTQTPFGLPRAIRGFVRRMHPLFYMRTLIVPEKNVNGG
ncbi:MAG: hypothetical protein QY324_14305 [Anaerolineales bacterium]|nr:MAG: hypothetical protein QY324_14305 [Anaerolineales bacterium]